VGVLDVDTIMQFDRSDLGVALAGKKFDDAKPDNWRGGHLIFSEETQKYASGKHLNEVQVIDFTRWMEYHILEREFDWPPILPADSAPLPPPSIIMKMDIEGPDPRLIGALMRSGALCSVNFTYAEHLLPHHIQLVNDFFNFAQCSSTISNMDDEGLHDTNIPLLEYSPTEGE
jgi:hypothetical protein